MKEKSCALTQNDPCPIRPGETASVEICESCHFYNDLEPKYRSVFPEFVETLRERMEQGFKEYGDKSFDRPGMELIDELEEEVLDICGWGLILYTKICELKVRIKEGEYGSI